MRRNSSLQFIVAAFAFIAACAQGMDTNTGDNTGDDTTTADANDDLPIDARPPDASIPIDAAPPIDSSIPIDAPTAVDGGPFCTNSSQCTVSGECCFSLSPPDPGFCVPGTEIGGVCFPIS